MFETVKYEINETVAIVTMNRPDALNAVSKVLETRAMNPRQMQAAVRAEQLAPIALREFAAYTVR